MNANLYYSELEKIIFKVCTSGRPEVAMPDTYEPAKGVCRHFRAIKVSVFQ